MSENNLFASALLEKGAAGYAGLAASLMLEQQGDADNKAEFEVWKSHITQRILELSAALSVSEPQLFANRAAWFRKALAARQIDESYVNASLESLKATLDERLPPVGKSAPIEYIDSALKALSEGIAIQDDSEIDPDSETGRLTLDYLQGVLEGNASQAIGKLLNELQNGRDPISLYTQVLLPAQREIGRLWHIGDVSVAEEHLVTSATKRAMAVLAQHADNQPSNGKTMVAAAVANNAHDIGIRAISDLYQMAGWRVIYLGCDVPIDDLPPMLTYFDADVLVLSATLDVQIPLVRETISMVRERADQNVRVLVGGYAFDQAPDIASTVGADAYTKSVTAALEIGNELTSG